jgi:predicted ferric reductase
MNYRLLLQSAVFVLEGLLLIRLLSAALHFEAARLVFAIAVAAFCLMVEIFVVVKVGQRLWKWSGRFAALMIRENSAKAISAAAAKESRGEA